MTIATANETVKTWLHQLKDQTEIRDAEGRALGVFIPRLSAEEELAYEKAKQLFDPAEIERRKSEQQGKGIPGEQVLQRLRDLENGK